MFQEVPEIKHFKSMPRMSKHKARIFAFLLLFFLFSKTYADSPCASYIIKATWYTRSGLRDSGYMYYSSFLQERMVFNMIDEYEVIHHFISPRHIDFSRIREFDTAYCSRILAVNHSLLKDTIIETEISGTETRNVIPVSGRIFALRCFDTIHYADYTITKNEAGIVQGLDSAVSDYSDVIHYANARYLDFDTIDLLVLDSILWCGDNDQVQWLGSSQVRKMKSQKPYSHFKVFDGDSQQFWVDFFSFDPFWTKSRIISSLNLIRMEQDFTDTGGQNILSCFGTLLQKAIKVNKIIYFVRWSP